MNNVEMQFDGLRHGLALGLSWKKQFSTAIVALVIALLSFSYLGFLEFKLRGGLPFQVDELFFATCAARGLDSGSVPISGCHDNKVPLIYVVYQSFMDPADPYNITTIKAAAFSVGAIATVLIGWLALRAGGAVAAALAVAATLQLFTIEPSFLALKTEAVGSVLMLATLLLLGRSGARLGFPDFAAAGLLMGLAVCTKQTFLFPFVGMLGGFVVSVRKSNIKWLGALARITVALLVAAIPGVFFLAYFYTQDRHTDFLASVFIYPAIYSNPVELPLIKRLALRGGELYELLKPGIFVVVLAFIFLVKSLLRQSVDVPETESRRIAAALLFGAFVGAFSILIVSPLVAGYHLLPFFLVAVVPAATLSAELLGGKEGTASFSRPFAVVLLTSMGLTALGAWAGKSGRPNRDIEKLSSATLASPVNSRYGYVVGGWPKFYADNGLIPSSDVLYPTAFPGAPSNWAYVEPAPSTPKGKMLALIHGYNVKRLIADFQATPPSVIAVVDEYGRAIGSGNYSDIKIFNQYIADNCHFTSKIENAIGSGAVANVYSCRTENVMLPVP